MLFNRSRDLRDDSVLENTARVEAYSDAVIAIVMTLLVFDIKVPHVAHPTPAALALALREVLPNFLTFVLSFITLAVVWVNHHHFFHPIRGTNRALLWINNGLLFSVCLIPFVTGLLGAYPNNAFAVALYGASMFLVSSIFAILIRYVFFHSNLVGESVPQNRRRREFRRSCVGPVFYGCGALLSLWIPWVSLVVYAFVPLYFFVPNTLEPAS